ncbi:hypothetical protein PR048_000233 [Dryococelus australis]|uniref:Uncharacterized protein n=1 Tax=Dryococelus australis TaxID=614101 RepID=A0ABQ9IE36_9NEOP|nr:hypothetical protein PR048_000233 [Dryococelus australis]
MGTPRPRSRSVGVIRATLTRSPSATSLLPARRAIHYADTNDVLPSLPLKRSLRGWDIYQYPRRHGNFIRVTFGKPITQLQLAVCVSPRACACASIFSSELCTSLTTTALNTIATLLVDPAGKTKPQGRQVAACPLSDSYTMAADCLSNVYEHLQLADAGRLGNGVLFSPVRNMCTIRGRGGIVVRLLVPPIRRSVFYSRRSRSPGFSHMGTVPDDVARRRVFSGFSRFPPALACRRCSILTPHFALISTRTITYYTKDSHETSLHICGDVNIPLDVPRFMVPTIKCPENVTALLPPGQRTTHVVFDQPFSSVDWFSSCGCLHSREDILGSEFCSKTLDVATVRPRTFCMRRRNILEGELQQGCTKAHVVSEPLWGKQLEGDLPAGEWTVIFTARHPVSHLAASCTLAITVSKG